MAVITVIGAGYVGLVTSACFASLGHRVRCVEYDSARLERISRGELPIYEPGLDELVAETASGGNLQFFASVSEALPGSEFAFIAVPTPAAPDGSSDLTAMMSVVGAVRDHADSGTVVVIKSTVPVGTGDSVSEFLQNRFPVVNNPEFLREGSAVREFMEPDRIVVGADDRTAARAVADLHAGIEAEVVFADRPSAELAKYASNAYLAVRLSFVNEIARISAATGADIDSVTRILASDHRIGSHYLKTGIGWGGSCLPKDLASLAHSGVNGGVEPFMLRAARVSNDAQIGFLVSSLIESLGSLNGKVIGILGTAFKAGTDDVRESPAITLALRLVQMGANMRVHDPLALPNTLLIAPELKPDEDIYSLTRGADAVILATDWPEYLSIDWQRVSTSMRGELVFDARNALKASNVLAVGLRYRSYGRSVLPGLRYQSPVQQAA